MNSNPLIKRRGAIIIDCLMAVFVLGLGAASFYSLFPTYKRAETVAAQEAKASQMAARLVENLQLLHASNFTASTLSSLHLIDDGQTQPPYSFSHIPMDEASMYSPAQSLPNGTGSMAVTTLSGNSVRAVITITWRTPSGTTRSLTTGTIVGGYR